MAERYISRSFVEREALEKRVLAEKASTLSRTTPSSQKYDVFLCHSSIDKNVVNGIVAILKGAGLTVYVDWIVDYGSTSNGISASNARMLKTRMNSSKYMVYVHTPNASASKWCPWEVGFFDKSAKPIYLALVSRGTSSITGQEYLDQYDRLTLSTTLRPILKSELVLNGNTSYKAFL